MATEDDINAFIAASNSSTLLGDTVFPFLGERVAMAIDSWLEENDDDIHRIASDDEYRAVVALVIDTSDEAWHPSGGGSYDYTDDAVADVINAAVAKVMGRPEPEPTEPATWPENDEERSQFEMWQHEVTNGDTLRGFRDWVAVNIHGDD